MAMAAAAAADVLVPRLEEKHEEPQEKKQKMTDEERQEEDDVPYREKVGLPLDDELQEKKQKKTDEEKQAVPYLSDDDDDDEDYFPGELPDMTRAELALYHQQVEESGGFDVDDFSHSFACGRIEKMGFRGVIDDADKKELGEYSMEAIHKYNTDEKKNFKFKEVVKANVQCVEGLMYYITFNAEDASTATIETFQAKVWRGIGFVEVTSIRVKPISISKQGNEDLAICCSRSS
uniref:Cystatin domain-containing protein n=2 Tax=Quercus lobata TaxID=97700 RepID=A0A7N2MRU9_QUELO